MYPCANGAVVRFVFYWKVLHRSTHHYAGEWGESEGPLPLPGLPLHRAAESDHLHLLSALHHPSLRAQHLQRVQGKKVAARISSSRVGVAPASLTTRGVGIDPQQCNRVRRSVETTVVQESITEPSVLTVAIRAKTDTRACPFLFSLFDNCCIDA